MNTTIASITAVLHEIFSGIQGEGLLVGYRQIFVRFHGCSAGCRFCDTPASRGTAPEVCVIERHPGLRTLHAQPNPLTVGGVLDALHHLQQGYPHHSVSLTGGEPLLHRTFLDALLPALRQAGLPSYLETNGLLPAELDALAHPPDYIAMDIKLPSTAGTPPAWPEATAFLQAAVRQLSRLVSPAEIPQRLQVKLVFGEESLDEVAQAAALVAACRPDLPCILQPVTPRPAGPPAPTPAAVLEAQRLAAYHLPDARVIPQTHVQLGQW